MALYNWTNNFKNQVIKKENITNDQIEYFQNNIKKYCYSHYSSHTEKTSYSGRTCRDTDTCGTENTSHTISCDGCNTGKNCSPATCNNDT